MKGGAFGIVNTSGIAVYKQNRGGKLMVETGIMPVLKEEAVHGTTESCKGFSYASPAPIVGVEPWKGENEMSMHDCLRSMNHNFQKVKTSDILK